MKLSREGQLQNDSIQSGNVLVVELFQQDVDMMVNEPVHRITNRFAEFPHGLFEGGMGWDAMDKVHVELKPVEQEGFMPVELALDNGGDLYFTIWDGSALRRASGDEKYGAQAPLVTRDPSRKLEHAGIEHIRFFWLDSVARALDR